MRVLQVTGIMNRGGAEVMLMDILRHKPADVHFDFLINSAPEHLLDEGVFDDEIRAAGCQMRYIGTQLRIGPRRYIKEFKKVVEELKPDVVHIHLNAKCGIIALAARKAGYKHVIAHCHADIKFHGSFLSNLFNETEVQIQKRLIARYATAWWGCSLEACKRLYLKKAYKKSVVINNAIDTAVYASVNDADAFAVRQSYGLPDDCLVLGNVGRIVPHKNIAFIIDVLAELHKRGQDAALVVAGRNDAPQYVEQMMVHANELGVPDDRIIFLGERGDIPVVMRSFDLFVGTALREGFGLVAVEAQAAGKPCVLYKGFPKTVDMELGLCSFIDSFDVARWADAVIEMRDEGKSLVLFDIVESIKAKGFDAEENSRRVCEMYKSML